jgi:hypothetical protein
VKIEYELETKVSRYATVDDALFALYGKGKAVALRQESHRIDMAEGLMYGTFLVPKQPVSIDSRGEVAVEAIRRQSLARAYEGALVYDRTCAHVSFVREWRIPELYAALDDKGYVPAGTSESIAYLKLLLTRGVAIGSTFHLGTHVVNELYEEQKLLVHDNGKVELVTMYGRTVVRPHWHIVATKKEKTPSTSVIFGRKK